MEPVAWSTSNLYSLELVGCRKLLTHRALKGPGLRDSGKTELVLVANTEMSSGNGGTLLRPLCIHSNPHVSLAFIRNKGNGLVCLPPIYFVFQIIQSLGREGDFFLSDPLRDP